MARYTLIQSGDFNAAENIGALAGDIRREGIVSGLGLSGFDTSVPEIDVAAGKTAHTIDSQTAEATTDNGTTITEQRDQVRLICHVDAQTLELTDAAVNELYLTPQPDIDDSPAVVATTSGDPTADALKIGEVDTSNGTVLGQWNKIEDDGTLSFPDADAANAALSSLPDGVGVIDRANDVLVYDDKLSAATLEAGTIIDGADVSHSDELADVTDVSPIQSSSDVTVTDAQAGTLSDGEFLQNSGGSLTGGKPKPEKIASDVDDLTGVSVFASSPVFSPTVFNLSKEVTVVGGHMFADGNNFAGLEAIYTDTDGNTDTIDLSGMTDFGGSIAIVPPVEGVSKLELNSTNGNSFAYIVVTK